MFAGVSACKLRAILVSVSPLATCTVPGFAPPADSASGAVDSGSGAAEDLRCGDAGRGLAAGAALWARAGCGRRRRRCREARRRGGGGCRRRRARCSDRSRGARILAGRIHRRIEKHGVLAHQAAARPIHFDQEGHERLGNGVGRVHQQNVAAILALADLERERREKRRTVDAIARERVAAGQGRPQRRQFVRASRQ